MGVAFTWNAPRELYYNIRKENYRDVEMMETQIIQCCLLKKKIQGGQQGTYFTCGHKAIIMLQLRVEVGHSFLNMPSVCFLSRFCLDPRDV
jgi:hypothetical protein